MAEDTGISWADSTFNPWLGCTKVGPGCDACYAESWGRRFGVAWGPGAPRRRTSASNWRRPIAWNERRTIAEPRRQRVFCASLADVFDNEVPEEWRAELFDLVRETTNLDWLIVTKRIGNAFDMLPDDWGLGYNNVTLIATVVNQAEYDRDAPKLFDIPARRRGLSIEPMLGPINLGNRIHLGRLHWVICGGESEQPGHKPRPINPAWVRDLRMDCTVGGIAFHFKQWGAWAPEARVEVPAAATRFFGGGRVVHRVGTKNAGRTLDGRTWDQYPR